MEAPSVNDNGTGGLIMVRAAVILFKACCVAIRSWFRNSMKQLKPTN
jgi:hypothetical protein